MKVIFLDIDGVLNDSMEIYNNTYDEYMDTPTDRHLQVLKDIVDKTNANIVLSSSWRLFKNSRDIVKKRLSDFGMSFIDSTKELGSRADEINEWLSRNTVERFVVLDDEPISYSFPKNLVKTTFETGLLPEHGKKAIAILNG